MPTDYFQGGLFDFGGSQALQNIDLTGLDQNALISPSGLATTNMTPEAGGLFDFGFDMDTFNKMGGMQGVGTLLGGVGGVYGALNKAQTAKGLLDLEKQKVADARARADREEQRQRDFIGTTQRTMSGGLSSDFYSA